MIKPTLQSASTKGTHIINVHPPTRTLNMLGHPTYSHEGGYYSHRVQWNQSVQNP